MDILTMSYIDLVLWILISLSVLHRLFVYIVSSFLEKFLKAEVQIERLGGFMCFCGIKIIHPQCTLDIERVALLLSDDGGRIKLLIRFDYVNIGLRKDDTLKNSTNPFPRSTVMQCYLPPKLATYSKWIILEVNHLNVHFKHADQHLVHLSTAKVNLYFYQHDTNQCVVAKASLFGAKATAECPLAENHQESESEPSVARHLLMCLQNSAIEAELLLTDDNFAIKRLSVEVDGVDVEVKEKLGVLIFGKCNPGTETDLQPMTKQPLEDAITYFSPVIPKTLHLEIHGIEVFGMKGSNSPYTVSIISCTIDSKFKPSSVVDESESLTSVDPNVTIDFCLSNVEMEINLLSAITIGEFSMNGKLVNKELDSAIELKSAVIHYHHEEWLKWLQLNFKKPLALQVNNNDYTEKNNSSSCYQDGRFLSRAEVNVLMSQFTAKYYQSPRQPNETASLDLDYMKVKYEKSPDMISDELRLSEMTLTKLWCHLGKKPLGSFPQREDRYHTWGSPLYVSLLNVRNPRAKESNPGPVAVQLVAVQMEWTPALSQVAPDTLRRMVDLQKAISDCILGGEAKPGGQRSCSHLKSRSVDITMLDCNVYLLDELVEKERPKYLKGDMCYMLRLDYTSFNSSPKETSFRVKGFKAATILEQQRNEPHMCTNTKQLKGYWLYVKSVEGHSVSPFGSMNIRLKEDVRLFWNQELHLRISAIRSNIHKLYESLCEVTHGCSPERQKGEECAVSTTIGAECPVKIVVDLFESKTQLHIHLSLAVISLDNENCVKAHISSLQILKGGLLGLNTASFCTLYNNFYKGYIYHSTSKTSIFLSLDPILQQTIQSVLLCEILFIIIYLL